MSGRRDFTKAKRRDLGRHGERAERLPAAIRGWRTEWDGPAFPVQVSTVKPQVSLRCGPWNAHEECRSPLCGCKCHEVPDAKRQG